MGHATHSDLILALDRQQTPGHPSRRLCQRDPDHGGMGAHGDGTMLVCTNRECSYVEPASLGAGDRS